MNDSFVDDKITASRGWGSRRQRHREFQKRFLGGSLTVWQLSNVEALHLNIVFLGSVFAEHGPRRITRQGLHLLSGKGLRLKQKAGS
jgi:hypothetical protein